ncbi:hypothetical protein [Clostridium sp. ATCC 25772]|uniref:hypothetical protein n=1 Tax=Clostridium sp. ATCC 25772 TaxID=1676991 RepID=UPI0007818098|nr:hypothetical protein [Clostridium sp. ATCC 25772]
MKSLFSKVKYNNDVKGYYEDCLGECSSNCESTCKGDCGYKCQGECRNSCGGLCKRNVAF